MLGVAIGAVTNFGDIDVNEHSVNYLVFVVFLPFPVSLTVGGMDDSSPVLRCLGDIRGRNFFASINEYKQSLLT